MLIAEDGPVLSLGGQSYAWIEEWVKRPLTEPQTTAWPHTGIGVTAADQVITFDVSDSQLVVFDTEGQLLRVVTTNIGEAHGMTLVVEDGAEFLWLADASVGKSAAAGYAAREDSSGSKVVKVAMDGRVVATLERPGHPSYAAGHYRPTCVAVVEERLGGNGDIWVGDGYGESYVHHFDRRGAYLGSLSGEEGGGRFKVPHAVFIDRRGWEPELYIADRANARIQVYGLDGQYHRLIEGFLSRPTWIAADGEFLIVVEFTPPRLTILDGKDRLVGYLAEGPVIIDRPGWPNELDAEGKPKRPSLRAGQLNSPHAVAVDSGGSLYVTEYLIGGRIPKLQKI
jgi:hypothetical protein